MFTPVRGDTGGSDRAADMDTQGDSEALAIIHNWGWDGGDPRFDFHVPLMISLREAVNRLAMEGHADPPGTILSLLAGGKLEATGSFRWKKYRNEHFDRDGVGPIPVARWAVLKATIAKRDYLTSKPEISLPMLHEDWGDRKEPTAEWNWSGDWFSTAEKSGGDWLDPDYFEETFSAADIEVRPSDAPAAVRDLEAPKAAATERSKGGAPAKYDWERAIAAIVFQWADEGSWQPAIQADVKNRLADWFAERGEHPSDSLLKERARWLFEEIQRRDGEADNLAA